MWSAVAPCSWPPGARVIRARPNRTPDMAAQRARLADGRLHLNHGPIDLIIEGFGLTAEVERAYDQAWEKFPGILPALTGELTLLREPIGNAVPRFGGPVARRMADAVWPYR